MVREELEKMLAEMQEMPPLPRAGSSEARAMHDEWMTKHEEYGRLYSKAADIAVIALPPEIFELLIAIQRRTWVLMGLAQEQ